jgi:DNA-binding NarL/FixJ family response regulator
LEERAGLSSLLTDHSGGQIKKVEPRPAIPTLDRATSIVLADSYDLIRQGLRRVLETEPGFTVVGEARSVQETLGLVKQHRPNVLVINWDMGLEATPQIAQLSPQTHVLIISDRGEEAYILDALRRGATGYIPKEASAEDLTEAVRHAAEGQRYLSREFSERAIDFYVKLQRTEDPNLDVSGGLTSREQEILQLIVRGSTNAEVADQLTISPRTVETHRANLMRKLGLRNQAELIRYALQRGIISLEK